MTRTSQKEKDEALKAKRSFSLRLSTLELVHLRDLFSIMLPADMKTTVSQALSAGQGRHMVESKLWNKISDLCKEAMIPLEDEAPDFVVSIAAPPQLNVFEMVAEDSYSEEDVPRGLVFSDEEEEA